jgi:hypothetical protein
MKRAKNNHKYLWFLPFLPVILLCGCWLISGTWVVVFAVADEDIFAGEGFHKFDVDITGESVWQDHKDNLHNVEDVAMSFKLINNLSTEATAKVYVSSDNTLSDSTAVKSFATLVLDGLTIPANDSLHVDLAYYYDVLQNFETLRDLVKTGVFTAYAIVPDPQNVHVRYVVAVVTFSAGM